ncbi:MAG TPA: VOC family protein [Actinoplanes sp.]|nr:VOC family protein [Actinoplanes sp.]
MFTEAFPMLTVPNLPDTVAFYRDLLGFRESYRFPPEGDPMFVTLRLNTSELGLGAGEVDGPTAGYALCVYADDCDAAVERLRAAGTPITEEPADMPWGERMARVTDPAGNEIVLVAKL